MHSPDKKKQEKGAFDHRGDGRKLLFAVKYVFAIRAVSAPVDTVNGLETAFPALGVVAASGVI